MINPRQLKTHQWNDVVMHEKVHISQWHQLDVVISEIFKAILWFMPVVWWYAKCMRLNLEFIADDISIKNGLNRKNYQLSLLSISTQPEWSFLVNNFSKKIIKNRIKMLNKMKTKPNYLSLYGVIFPLLVGASLFLSIQAQAQQEKIKKVIVITDEKIKDTDVKVMVKSENGAYEQVSSDEVQIIKSGEGNMYHKTMKNSDRLQDTIKSKDDFISIVKDFVEIRKNLDSLDVDYYFELNPRNKMLLKGEFSDSVEIKNIKIQSKEREILKTLAHPPKTFEETKEFYDKIYKKENLRVDEGEYKKLSRKEKRQIDRIKKKLKNQKKSRQDNSKNKFFKIKKYNSNIDLGFKNYANIVVNESEAKVYMNRDPNSKQVEFYINGESCSKKDLEKIHVDEIEKVSTQVSDEKTKIRVTTKKKKAGKEI